MLVWDAPSTHRSSVYSEKRKKRSQRTIEGLQDRRQTGSPDHKKLGLTLFFNKEECSRRIGIPKEIADANPVFSTTCVLHAKLKSRTLESCDGVETRVQTVARESLTSSSRSPMTRTALGVSALPRSMRQSIHQNLGPNASRSTR